MIQALASLKLTGRPSNPLANAKQEASRLRKMEQAAASTTAPIERTRRHALSTLWRWGKPPRPPLLPDVGRGLKAATFTSRSLLKGGSRRT